MRTSRVPSRLDRRIVTAAVLAGIGLAGTLDEVVLHQLLRWHHLYSRGSEDAGLVSDGLFHVFSTTLLLVGTVGVVRAVPWHRRPLGLGRRITVGVLAGLGGFNVYDSLVQHKLLGLHQVREGVPNLLPYDVGFTGLAVLALAAGLLLLRSSPRVGPG